ncbi:hypothetical protein [Brevundimonas lenta]|uniref:Uncharacterized protein n=1 Tax=Brevundimonas lenta TaxID=424796 RepID=A0A7W6JG12_9CAUL|nr:hypothetical protein [Brevundimonas lenta]MBB4083458.1 hypothetical protein [Brevundimonas lenta]
MFDTAYSMIGAAVTLLVVAFAFIKGEEPERIGAGAFVFVFIASLLIQDESNPSNPQWGLMAVDTLLLVVYAGLAWKSGRSWPLWAAACQALIVMTHVLVLLDLSPTAIAFYVVTNLAGYGILVAIAIGTFWAWQDRRAAGLE